MKKIILLELCLLFLATTFNGDNPPPGWYLQTIPVNKNIVDIHFTDTLHGWAVTTWTTSNDTAYILKTTNGGTNWLINSAPNIGYKSIQFIDTNTGYVCGGIGVGQLYKTTNSGLNWNLTLQNGHLFSDLHFLNKDTGWVCDDDNLVGIGLLKTTNGGLNWLQQLSQAYSPKKLFYLNKDTGWVMCAGGGIYRTNNSGNNWMAMYNFGSTVTLNSIFFTSSDTGWVIESQFIYKTINGGYNWSIQQDPYSQGSAPKNVFMINSSTGYISTAFYKILKTTDGITWRQQNAPAGGYNSIYFSDSLKGWSRHSSNGDINIAATQDGGGPVVGLNNISSEVPKDFVLEQNYPNPFNATSNIKYKTAKSSDIQIVVFDIGGRKVSTLVKQKQSPGTYEYKFDGSNISSGIYFYTLFADGVKIETRRMMLLK